ncbi:hypothetical protein [Streptomyces sp. MAR4 CNX-425]|uniref:hypothetical protein n=1 Tax=Streptomyces sp. MAR4 CNX-425 TaxID=3406343 RepID=UPI003B50DE39
MFTDAGPGTSPAAHRRDRIAMQAALTPGPGLPAGGLIGGLPGITVPPFDPHHRYGQFGGLVPVLFGLTRWR